MAQDKGWYAAAYATLLDSPEYEALSADAAAVWWALKFCPENNQLGVFVFFNEQVAHRAKVPPERVQAAIRELERGDWIRVDGRWVWLRNHLKFDPNYQAANPKHAKGLVSKVGRLPWMPLTEAFIKYYQRLGYIQKGYRYPTDSHPKATARQAATESIPVAVSVAVANTDTKRTTEAPPSAPPPEPPPTPATEREARTRARKVLGAVALPPRWNQEFADDFRAVYRVKFVPNQFFRQVEGVAVQCGWEATRPVLRQYMRETPVDLLAIPKALRVRVEQAQNGGPPPRAGPQSVGEKTLGALERFVARGGELDRPSDVREGPGTPGKRLPPAS